MFMMKRVLTAFNWGDVGPQLGCFKNLKTNVGFEVLEEVWTRAFKKNTRVREMAKKAVITTFDSVRIEILSEEACARWFQYYHAVRADREYYPGEKDVIHSLLSKITINTDLSRAAFDTSKEEIFAEMMKTGTFKRQQGGNTEAKPSGTLRRMLSTS